jgi:hypothetical protein
MIKKHFWKTLLILVLLMPMNNLKANPEIVDWKVLSGSRFDTSKIYFTELFIDKDNDVFVEVVNFLWMNKSWLKTDEYGFFLNGFSKYELTHLAFETVDKQHIDIYTVGRDITLENRVAIEDFPCGMDYWPGLPRIVYVPGDTNALFLLGSRTQLPRNPSRFLVTVLSGGHGNYYDKPILAQIQGQTLLEYRKIPYGGKTDESYRIKEVLTGKDTIHLLGFRTQEQMGSAKKPDTPVILHYAAYNVKKRKTVRTQNIYEDTPRHELGTTSNEHINYSYGGLSADNLDDENVVVVFSWIRNRFIYKGNAITEGNIILSQIYYAQCGSGKFDGVEKIGEGFVPLVRVDSLGNVHVIWVNNNGALVHKVKKRGKWSNEEVFLDGVDNTSSKLFGNYVCAEFDKDNILNVVFPSKGNFVHAKVKFD